MTQLETERPVRSIAIIGGGTAGWMSAAAISKSFGRKIDVVLIESEEIGIIGVGEATVPHLSAFNRLLQIDEAEFVRQTKGSFKLGIQFNDWGKIGDSYIHGFGTIGRDLGLMPFHQYWLKARSQGHAKDISEYSLNTIAAPQGKFMTLRATLRPIRRWRRLPTPTTSTPFSMRASCGNMPKRAAQSGSKARSSPSINRATTASSKASSSRAARSSGPICSWIARVSAHC
nr:tryptophan halogenase [uncultured bacterium]